MTKDNQNKQGKVIQHGSMTATISKSLSWELVHKTIIA